MSRNIDSNLPESLHLELLDEVRQSLPAFLYKGASEQHDPVGDVRELLNLEEDALRKVLAVHQCLDKAVLRFGETCVNAMRHPITSTERPPEVSQVVRGPVDWGQTVRRRSLEAGNSSLHVIRAAERVYDVPENQTVAWLVETISARATVAGSEPSDAEDDEQKGWFARIVALGVQMRLAGQAAWLSKVKPRRPDARTLQRLASARSAFYAQDVYDAASVVLKLESVDEDSLTEVLAKRYFRPTETWRLFEVAIALRLAHGFSKASAEKRKTRLLEGGGRAPYARYVMSDGSEIRLCYQHWPAGAGGGSLRWTTAQRHGFKPGFSRPDLFIAKSEPNPDAAILELKATRSAGYLGQGLSQLLSYLGERPGLFTRLPAGWLVAPESGTYSEAEAESDKELWVVGSENVAERAIQRFAS